MAESNAFIYVLRCEGYLKVGKSDRPDWRIQNLQIGNPFPIETLRTIAVAPSLAYPIETAIHAKLRAHHHRGEWFRAPLDVVEAAITEAIADAAESQERRKARKRVKRRLDPGFHAERIGAVGDYWVSPHPRSGVLCRTWFDSGTRQTKRVSLHTRDAAVATVLLAEWCRQQLRAAA